LLHTPAAAAAAAVELLHLVPGTEQLTNVLADTFLWCLLL
jgi:hypothetical protein